MLSHPLDEADLARLDPADFAAEWKWDGIRVQASAEGGRRRLYSRTGDDISAAFPDLVEALDFEGALDGELLVRRPDGGIAPFADLQQRLNRKTVTPAQLRRFPAMPARLRPAAGRRPRTCARCPSPSAAPRLEAFVARLDPARFDLSPLLPFATWDDLAAPARRPARPGDRGRDAQAPRQPLPARPPQGPLVQVEARPAPDRRGADVRPARPRQALGLLLRLHLRRLGRDGAAASRSARPISASPTRSWQIDRFVRNNTIDRFGPVRAVRAEPDHGLVLEVAFEGLNRSTRHKSGVAMRFPRINRLRWDKPPREADRLETLEAMLPRRRPIETCAAGRARPRSLRGLEAARAGRWTGTRSCRG